MCEMTQPNTPAVQPHLPPLVYRDAIVVVCIQVRGSTDLPYDTGLRWEESLVSDLEREKAKAQELQRTLKQAD